MDPPVCRWSPRLGQRVQAARQRAGLSRAQLAERIGVTEESVRRWEVGWTQPSPERLARLLVVLALDGAGLAGNGAEAGVHEAEAPPPGIARLLRRERSERGISQAAAAHLVGVAQATYAGWEVGRALPEARYAPALARFLGMAPNEVARLIAPPVRGPREVVSALGELMVARRAELGLSREALAEAVGVGVRTIGAWERGEKTPRSIHLRRLATALGVPAAELAGLATAEGLTALGALVERERLARGLTREEFAKKAAIAPTTLTRWAHGRNRPSSRALRQLAAALQLDVDAVLRAAGRAV